MSLTIDDVTEIIRGVTFKKSDTSTIRSSELMAVLRSGNVQKRLITDDKLLYIPKDTAKERQLLQKNDIVVSVSNSRELVGKTAVLKNDWEGTFGAFLTILRTNPNEYNPRFLYFYTQSAKWDNEVKRLASATNNIANINNSKLSTIELPVFSLDQQEKIVAKIEELFSEIDSGLLAVLESKSLLVSYQQSLLDSLFADKKATTIGGVASEVRYGTSKKCTYEATLTPVLRIPNIKKGEIDKTDMKYASFDDSELSKLSLSVGDLLVIRSNGSPSIVGKCAEVRPADEGILFAGYLIRLRFNPDSQLARFYKYLLSSPKLREQIEFKAKSTSGVNNINAEELKSLAVPDVTFEEQKKIVKLLDEKTSEIHKMEESIVHMQAQLSQLKQSILSSAFKGELE